VDSRPYILIVDKDVDYLREILLSAGYDVQAVSDGDEALVKIEKHRPELIISEIKLPKIDGWELCWIIRERADLLDIPFIFLTSKTSVSDEVFSLDIGADDVVHKPFVKNELLARIKGLLARVNRVKHSSISTLYGVKGTLKDMSFSDVLQVLNMGNRTAAVHLTKGEKHGCIYVVNGQVSHARYAELKGEEALFYLMSWDDGNFTIETGVSTNLNSINLSTEMILLKGCKRMDEGKKRGVPPTSESMEEGETLTLKTLFDLGIIEDERSRK
jgi:DNA-binding response OmpR family regulator